MWKRRFQTIIVLLGIYAICYLVYLHYDDASLEFPLSKTTTRNETKNMKNEKPLIQVGVFMQVGNPRLWPQMSQCLANVIAVPGISVGVHISLWTGMHLPQSLFETSVYQIARGRRIAMHITSVDTPGEDIGQFVLQLVDAELDNGKTYDISLKIHSNIDAAWHTLIYDSLCGSASQVESAIRNFMQTPDVDLIAPAGTVFYVGSHLEEVAPVVRRSAHHIFSGSRSFVPDTLFSGCEAHMQSLGAKISPGLGLRAADRLTQNWTIVAGRMFWVRYAALRPEKWATHIKGVELSKDCIERFFPTLVQNAGGGLAVMPPAPKVFLSYHMSYDFKSGGIPFLEIPDTKAHSASPLNHKSTSMSIQEDSIELAKTSGVQGVLLRYYWHITSSPLMDLKALLMLEREMANLPFFLCWVAEVQTVDTGYGRVQEWIEHAEYLARFFVHENYIKAGNKPLLAIDRLESIADEMNHQDVESMLETFVDVAKRNGFAGIYFINTAGKSYLPNHNTDDHDFFQAALHMLPIKRSSFDLTMDKDRRRMATVGDWMVSVSDFPFVTERCQFWGAYFFSKNKTRGLHQSLVHSDKREFERALLKSFEAMPYKIANFNKDLGNLFFLSAWNGDEQTEMNFGHTLPLNYFKTLQNSLRRIPARPVNSVSQSSVSMQDAILNNYKNLSREDRSSDNIAKLVAIQLTGKERAPWMGLSVLVFYSAREGDDASSSVEGVFCHEFGLKDMLYQRLTMFKPGNVMISFGSSDGTHKCVRRRNVQCAINAGDPGMRVETPGSSSSTLTFKIEKHQEDGICATIKKNEGAQNYRWKFELKIRCRRVLAVGRNGEEKPYLANLWARANFQVPLKLDYPSAPLHVYVGVSEQLECDKDMKYKLL